MSNKELGAHGEEIGAQYLLANDFEIIQRNWRCKTGEIDLIALSSREVIHFCEVKTRRTLSAGDPIDSITPTKARRLQHLALTWLLEHGRWGSEYSIDCMGIIISENGHTIDYRPNIL